MTQRLQININKNGYQLTKAWFDFVFESKESVRPIHTALYLWIVELNNRLHWEDIFGLPTEYSMQAIGVKGYQHYKKALDDLVSWGFISFVSKSQNQHTCNQISLNLPSTLSMSQGMKQGMSQGRHNKTYKTTKTNKTIKNDFSTEYNPTNVFESLAFKLWKQIYDDMIMQSIKPTNHLKVQASTWITQIRLMIEIDNRTEAEIEEVLHFLTCNDFWRKNIRSTGRLRNQFERLQTEARSHKPKKNKQLSSQQDLTKMDYYSKP